MQIDNGKRRLPSWAWRFGAMCAVLAVAAAGSASAAPAETVLYSFCSKPSCIDGNNPVAGLIADSAVNLYGTTSGGGASNFGVVFKLAAGGTETVLFSFPGSVGCNAFPEAGLYRDSKGNLYGTTAGSGADSGGVFRLSAGGACTPLHSFAGPPSDGQYPQAGLIADSAGNLYGTTSKGGKFGAGSIFKLSPSGTSYSYKVLHSFNGGSAGAVPQAGLVIDSSGNLYGTTVGGGSTGNGAVFRLSPGGIETVLHSFCSKPRCSDGHGPVAGLYRDSHGNLYGTTTSGGALNFGVAFELSPPIPPATVWKETVLYSFKGGSGDGADPDAGLIADGAGNLYGITFQGGGSSACFAGCGVAFKLLRPIPPATVWKETVLHIFKGSDGGGPRAGLIADSSGNLYGTTEVGGASGSGCGGSGCGTVFKITGAEFAP